MFWSGFFALYNKITVFVSFFFSYTALRLAGIDNLFDVVLGNEDYKEHKPKPDAFITAASRLGVKPEECWGFEDT